MCHSQKDKTSFVLNLEVSDHSKYSNDKNTVMYIRVRFPQFPRGTRITRVYLYLPSLSLQLGHEQAILFILPLTGVIEDVSVASISISGADVCWLLSVPGNEIGCPVLTSTN